MGARLRHAVFTPAGTFIAHIPNRKGVRGQDEHNTPGNGSFDVHADDQVLTDHPTLLDQGNVVRVYQNNVVVTSWLIEGPVTRLTVASGEASEVWYRVSGRGGLGLLSYAVIRPEYALRRDSADERSFDYGSKDGGWREVADWVNPMQFTQGSPLSIRKGLPVRWPDRSARWLWSTNPNAASTSGINYFRGSFTLAATTRVTIYAAGDDRLWLQLNGEYVMQRSWRQWRSPGAYTTELAAGTHLIAAAVQNHQAADATHGGAFLCSVAQVDRNNKIVKWLLRSASGSFKVRGYGAAPGWFAASILKTCVQEAKDRGVEGFSNITFGFDDTEDSDGTPWTDRHDRSFPIATTDLLDLVARLSEHDIDVAMGADFVLHAWVAGGRGTDRRDTIRLLPGENITSAEVTTNSAKIRNRAVVRHKVGWVEGADSASEAEFGRREFGIVLGNTHSDGQANAAANAAMAATAQPETTITVTMTSEAGPQPWAHFGIHDIITAPGVDGVLGPCRVMSISYLEDNDTGVITFTLELYPEV